MSADKVASVVAGIKQDRARVAGLMSAYDAAAKRAAETERKLNAVRAALTDLAVSWEQASASALRYRDEAYNAAERDAAWERWNVRTLIYANHAADLRKVLEATS
jgi:hypothetical protein